jgi:hypothetical protein
LHPRKKYKDHRQLYIIRLYHPHGLCSAVFMRNLKPKSLKKGPKVLGEVEALDALLEHVRGAVSRSRVDLFKPDKEKKAAAHEAYWCLIM